MPAYMHKTALRYKDENGRYVSVDAVSEASAAEKIEQITEAANEKITIMDGKVASAESARSAAQAAASTAAAAYGTDLLATTFDQTQAYPEGKYVIYSGGLYVLPNGHTANATWANTTKTQVNMGNEVQASLSRHISVSGSKLVITL